MQPALQVIGRVACEAGEIALRVHQRLLDEVRRRDFGPQLRPHFAQCAGVQIALAGVE
jgi:hypothetical protein